MIYGTLNKEHIKDYSLQTLKDLEIENAHKLDYIGACLADIGDRLLEIEQRLEGDADETA